MADDSDDADRRASDRTDEDEPTGGYGDIPYGGTPRDAAADPGPEPDPEHPRDREAGTFQDAIEGPVESPPHKQPTDAPSPGHPDATDETGHAGPTPGPQEREQATPTTAYPDRGNDRPQTAAEADVESNPDETVLGVPVGESGVDPEAVARGESVQPPEPPVEARGFQIEYNRAAGYVGIVDAPDEDAWTLSTNTTLLDLDVTGHATVREDRQDTIITAKYGHGYELRVRIEDRYADRESNVAGTQAMVDVVERGEADVPDSLPGESEGEGEAGTEDVGTGTPPGSDEPR